MRFVNVQEVLTGTDMADDINGKPIDISHCIHAAVHLVWTGSPVGTLRLQASNDAIPAGVNPNSVAYGDLTWIDIDTQAVSGANSKLFAVENAGYKWITVFWDDTSGTGTITKHTLNAKGYA